MLQPRESRLLWRRRKRRHDMEGLCCNNIYSTLIVIGCLTLLPQGLTQQNDDVYIVKPTPALRLGKEELTTVLLVNNENHGRYINVRPEVGLLTSTARTFIQEGVTTEYATQVVGTTLDNGRVYAQYLKKSSRVLYDSGVPVPSVVTSWVGESLHSDAGFLHQSHNDLFDADQPDWQAIDDRLLGDHRNHRDDFIGNTDYAGLRNKPLSPSNFKGIEEAKTLQGTSSNHDDYTSKSKPAYNFVAQLRLLEDNAHKVAANKVLPIGDLPTYTIKQNYEPSAYLVSNDKTIPGEYNDSDETFGRNPKLIYKQLMQSSLKGENKSDSPPYPRPAIPVNRHFATVTYYGFADFTTVVGDSVIVFSPSTSRNNLNYNAHVTSIKGEATLGARLPQDLSVSKVPITISQDIIEPTITHQPTIETLLETVMSSIDVKTEVEDVASSFTTTEVVDNKSTETEQLIPILETSEVVVQPSLGEMSSVQSSAIEPSVMLSRPSDEEILRIYSALANANAGADASKTKFESAIATNTTTLLTLSTSTNEIDKETSNVQIFGGATTIFFEDDPFANFVVPSKTSVSLDSTTTSHSELNSFSDDSILPKPSILSEDAKMESTTTSKIFEVTTEQDRLMETTEEGKLIETTTDQSLTTSETKLDTDISNTITTPEPVTKQVLEDTNSSPNILPSVLVKEIDPDNDEGEASGCINTSQVFLTQLPKTVTVFETVVITDASDISELKTKITQKIQPTFEITEATKYYCIQASTILTNQIENPLVNPEISASENGDLNDATYKADQQSAAREELTDGNNEEDKTEMIILNTTEENKFEVQTERHDLNESREDATEQTGNDASDDADADEDEHDHEEEEASGQPEDDEDDEEIELIYKTLYTTYTYLTTFFHDDSTSVSSHTEVVTNVMTSTLGTSLTKGSAGTNLIANLDDNEINPTGTLDSTPTASTKRFMVPSEVESFIRTDEEMHRESEMDSAILDNSIVVSKNSETLATFYTTYTYYTTIFAEGDTEIMSHTEVITNLKKATVSATTEAEKIIPTVSYFEPSLGDGHYSSSVEKLSRSSKTDSSSVSHPESALTSTEMTNLPNIPDLGDLSAITLVTDVRSSSSPGNKQIINNFEAKIFSDKAPQQQSIFEDQISSESNTDTDEIIPSATLLLQTSFTTFTYYTTMYSGDKTNVISRLETMTNTVTETLQPSRIIDLEGASVPITYFTTFTYWTKLVREGQITTLSREETISNVIVPTAVQQETQSQIENSHSETEKPSATDTTEASLTDETTLPLSKEENKVILDLPPTVEISTNTSKGQYKTNVLEPTTYYTTYTYYTTSYEIDKTITDSRFETVTNIITPTVTITNTNTGEHGENSAMLDSSIVSLSSTPVKGQSNIDQDASDLVLYDFKKIIDADGISTIFFTTEIKPTINSDGLLTQFTSSSSSLLIDEEKRNIQATAIKGSSAPTVGPDGQTQKQYKTGLVRLIEGTRIANRTTTLYQSKVIGTVIDQRYAQIIESTSSFIFEKTNTPTDIVNINTLISPTSSSNIENVQATEQVIIPINSLSKVEGSILESSLEQSIETTTKQDLDANADAEENNSKTDEKLRFPFQTKKPPFISPLKPFSNRSRPQFAPKKNSNATIITRSDFTPTITATPALKTISRFSSTRRGSANGISSSNSVLFATSSRRFGRPSKPSITGAGNQVSSSLGATGFSGASRNRFASSSSNTRASFSSSSRRLGGLVATIKPSFSRPHLFSSGFPGNSRLRARPTATTDLGEVLSTVDISTSGPFSSQEEGLSQAPDESDDEEENVTESNRRQNNPLLRLRRPLNRPQGFTTARPQPNSPNNAVSLRRNPLISRSRNSNSATTTTTTTTAKPKARTFQAPFNSQNRIRTTNSLFPPRNIFGVQKPAVTTEENRDLSEEDTNENNDDSEYEDDDDEESEGDDEEETSRRRRSNNKTEQITKQKNRRKREADSSQHSRSNFRNRFRRPKLASPIQTESRSYEDDGNEAKETTTNSASLTTSTHRTRSRFGARYSSTSLATTAATTAATSSNHKAIRPTRPATNNGGRSQFTLREKDSPVTSTTQKGLNSVKRPAFRRPQPGNSVTSRRLPSSTVPSSSTSGKRRLKSYTNSDSTTTSRNSVTGRSRPSSTTSGRSRSSGPSRDNNIGGRNRGRNNHNYNNNEGLSLDNSGTIIVTHAIPAEVTIPVVNGKVTEYKQVVTAKTSTEVLGPQQYTTTIGANGLPQLALTREDSTVNYNGATEVTKYILHETPTTTITFTPTTIRGRKTSFSHVLPSTVYSVEQVVSTVQPQISANAPLANILLSQLLLGNVGLPAANPLLGALGGALTQPGVGLGTAVGPAQPATPVTEYKTHASTYVTTVYEGQSTVLPVTFQGKKILTTIFDTTAQTITATEFITDTIVTTPTVMAQPQPIVNSLLLQQLLLQQHLQQQQQLQQSTPDSSYPLNGILNSVPPQFLLGGDSLQELEASNNIRGSGHGDLLNEDDDFAIGSSVDLDDIALQAQAQTHKNGRKKTRKNASEELHKQFQHFDSGQDDSKSDKFVQRNLVALRTSYDSSNAESNNVNSSNNNKQNQNDDIDEARYNLATRVMSNGVEVIIASDKTKSPEHIVPEISNSQLQYNKPMTLAASTIKNQMMILLFPSSPTTSDNNFVVDQSVQQLNYNLPFHNNHFITKTCLTTYTYRTTYVQDGHTTVESREKVISNIATEERNYPKITPTQTIGVTLTKTPELAVGIFPTTYSYFNTFEDNSDKLQVVTSEYTVVNTITGPNDYVAYLQPTAKATPALKTNTYYSEVTVSQMIKSKMHTAKRNLTQVVVTKSYTPAHSTSVLTSYYAYDADSLEDPDAKFHFLTTGITPNEREQEAEKLHEDKSKIIDDIHIYATKTFLSTFTYYTTTVLNSYLSESSKTALDMKPLSTVFNYYTRVIENVITENVPATLLPNELLAQMRIELRKRKPHQRRRLIVTTATLKDGQTVKISAMEPYKGNMASDSFTLSPLSSITTPPSQPSADLEEDADAEVEDLYLNNQENIDANDRFQFEESTSSSGNHPSIESVKRPTNQEINDGEETNGFASLPSEQIVTVVDAPTKQTSNTNINAKPSSSAANQLIQRLTALKPMFNAMADLLQNNFGVTRESIKPIKDIESKQASNKNISSSATNSTIDTKHPIYIPVQKSPIKNYPYEISNYTDFVPQSLHIKPPLLANEGNNFEMSDKENTLKDKHKTNIIPLSTLTSPRQEQPLHNGGIYIRPGEIITANSDVIVGKPNGIEYAQIPNQLHVNKNTSKTYSLDNRQFQVTYYHNKVQHPYKKKSSSALTSIAQKPPHIPIVNNGKVNNKLSPQPTFGLRPPNEKHFNKNILKPPPPPPTIQSHIPIHSQQGLSLVLTAPDKPARMRIKQQTTTKAQLSAESTSPLHLHSPPSPPSSTPPRETQNFYNFNNELKNNEILEIQQIPQIFSADLKPSSMQSSSLPKLSHTNRKPTMQSNLVYSSYTKPHIETNFEEKPNSFTQQNAREPHTPSTYIRLKPETQIVHPDKGSISLEKFPTFAASSIWQNGREPQIESSTSPSYIYVDQKTNVGVSDRNTKLETGLIGSALVWNMQHGHQPQISNQFPSHIIEEKYTNSALSPNPNKRQPVPVSPTNLADMEIFVKSPPASQNLKQFPYNLSSNTVLNNEKINRKQNINYNYFNESVTKNHQNVSLEQHIFSHTVDVNVPPLTFNREDHDYPQQTATAVRGQIPPATVKELKTQAENAYKYMPLITIPAHELQVQVNLTPLNSISALTLPLETQNEPSWNTEVANSNIVRKISLPNNNFKVFTNDQDQKILATNNILHTKPKSEASSSWKHHRRQQLPSYSRLNNKSQMPATTKPFGTSMQQAEEKKSKTGHHFRSTLKPNRKHHPTIVSPWESHVLPHGTTIQPLPQVPGDLKYSSETEHVHVFPTTVEQIQINEDPSKEKNRATRLSTQQIDQFGKKFNKTIPVITTTKASKNTTTTSDPTPADINEMNSMNSNNKSVKNVEKATRFVTTHGEPFKVPNNNNRSQDKEVSHPINNQSNTAAIFVVPGEAFKKPIDKHNAIVKTNTLKPEQHTTKTIPPTTKTSLLIKEVSATRETRYPTHHTKKIFAETTTKATGALAVTSKPFKMDAKLSAPKTNIATTETVFGLYPPPLTTPTNATTIPKKIQSTYLAPNNSREKSYEVARKRQPNKANQITLNGTNEMAPEQVKSAYVTEENAKQPDDNFSSQNIVATIELVNSNEITKSENNASQATSDVTDLENESHKSTERFKLSNNLQPSEAYEGKIATTTTSPLVTSILTFTTTTTIKRIILPTKYITDKRVYTVTTTASAPQPLPPSPTYLQSTSVLSTIETTTEVSTLFLTHTKINTVIDTVTSVKTLEPVTITTTTTLKPSSTESPLMELSSIKAHLPDVDSQFSFSSTESHTLEINQDLTYLPYPSVEVVSNNVTQDANLNPNENSIFIIMTNNKNKKNGAFIHRTSSHPDRIPQQHSVGNNIGQIDETNEVVIEYDNGISFDDIPIRDEEPAPIVNGKSVSSSAFINNVESVKESSPDDHVILGGVLIATPPKFPTKHLNSNESYNEGCHPKCRVSRNEQCGLVDSYWSCFCRPGFARMFPDRPCKPTYTYDLLMHAERIGNYTLQYVSELKNNKTEHYKQLSQLVNNALDRMIMQSDFRDAYHGVEVTQYTDSHKNHHGIFINVLLQLSDNSNEKRLEEVLKKNLRLSNYSIGGTDLYTNKAGVDALAIKDFNECMSRKLHDCSENAYCFNLPGSYTCSCVEGFADLSDNPIYPGRICSSEEIGCEMCHYHGKCSVLMATSSDVNYCECFPWYAGSKCQVNLKILLIVLLGIGTLLFILLLFCILITCTKRRNNLQHTVLAPSTMTSSSEGLQNNSQLAANMVLSSVGMRSSLRGINLKNKKRQKPIKIDKRSMIKDSSSETSQNSLPYVLKNRESIAGSCNKKKTCLHKHNKSHRNCGCQGNTVEQYPVSVPSTMQIETQSDLNTVITDPSSFKGNNQQTEQQNLLGNVTEYEGHYCEQSDRSLTVMIPRAKYHSSVLPQTQLMHHQLTMERVYKTAKSEMKSTNADKDAEIKRYYKKNVSTTREIMDEGKRTEIPSNPGALISAGFEVSAIVRDNTTIVNSGEQHNDLVHFDSIPPNYTIVTTSEPATSLDSNSDQKHLLNEERQPYTSNKKFPTNESDYNAYKCEKDLIETMDEWLGNVKRNELSAEARSFDETTIRASTKPLRISTDGTQTLQDSNAGTQTHDELNTMAERDLGSTFLLPHTHLYKPERQESELSGFDSF